MHPLLKIASAAAGAAFCFGCGSDTAFFVASDSENGVLRYASPAAGAEKAISPFPFSWVEKRGAYLYGAGKFSGVNGVLSFKMDPAGTPRLLNALPSPDGKGYCHLAVSPDGKFLYGASYSGGAVDEFELNPDGSLKRHAQRSLHYGGTNATKRQKTPHPHYVGFTPDGKYLVTVDLGTNELISYEYDAQKGIDTVNDTASALAPLSSGPRHLVFSGDGAFAFVLNELDNSLHSMRRNGGAFQTVDILHTLPPEAKKPSYAGAVRLAPDGRTLYLTHRGADLISVVSVDRNGKLSPVENVPSQGQFPYDLEILPGGILAVANYKSHRINFFEIGKQGRLTPLPFFQGVAAPMRIGRFEKP